MEVPAGTRLASYEIQDVLGRGGMGVVYRARHVNLDRPAAVKVLHEDLTSDKEFVERFTQEARLAAQLRHPNIATVYDFGCAEGRYFIAMELAEGVPLSRMLSQPIPLDLAVSILKQVAAALAVAHQSGVIHRDLKPANILVNARGTVVLTDFGIAKSIRSQGLTVAGTLVGTPEYMAPEQALGHAVDPRTDIYALGVILYETCAGEPPFQEDSAVQTAMRHVRDVVPSIRDAVPDLPDWVDAVVKRCCDKDPQRRYQTVIEFADALPSDVHPPLPVYPDVLARTGSPDVGSTLTAILRGDEPVEQVVARMPEWEQMIRSTLEREVTVASLDIVGSRGMKAPGRTVVLSYLFEKVRRFIDTTCDEYGCFARAWSGDGLAAVFEDPASAVHAMQAIIRRLPEFDTPEPGRPFRVRVGIDTGRVIFRETGELGRVTSRVFDTAGHLQKASRPDEICASETAVQTGALQGEFAPQGQIEDVYVWAWWEPSTPREPVRRRVVTSATGAGGRRFPVALAIVAACVVLALLVVGGVAVWKAVHRAPPVKAPLAPYGIATPSGGASPETGSTAETGQPPREAPTPQTAEGQPAASGQPAPASADLRLAATGPTGSVVTTEVYRLLAEGGSEAVAVGADGALKLDKPGRYEVYVRYDQGPGSSAASITATVIDAAAIAHPFTVPGLWPVANPEGQPVASADRATARACVVTLGEDGALQYEP